MENVTQYVEVSGIVRGYSNNRGTSTFKIHCPNMGRTFSASCSFFCPLRNDDAIIGKCRLDDNDHLELVTPPFVQPPCDITSITNYFIRVTRKGFAPCRALYQTLAKLAGGENEVVLYLTDLAQALRSSQPEEVLTLVPFEHQETLHKILKAWYRDHNLRRLYLLGLTKTDISACEPLSCERIYQQCVNNPYTLAPISLEKCTRIQQILRKTTNPLDIYRGQIIRSIYEKMQNGWVGIPHNILVKSYSDITKHLEVLHDEYHVRFDRTTYYLKGPHGVEKAIAEKIQDLVSQDTITYETPVDTNNLRASATFLHEQLSSSQKKAIQGALDHKLCIITGGAGTGKCLHPDTPVQLYNGEILEVNKLAVGMILQGPDGQGREILSLTTGTDRMFKVKVSNYISFECNEPHILTLRNDDSIIDVPLNEYLAEQEFYHNYRLWQIPPAYSYRRIIYNPYVVGYWFATVDKTRRVWHHLQASDEHYQLLKSLLKSIELIPNGATWIMKEPKVLSDTARNLLVDPRYLTDDYLYNTLQVRQEIVAGIVDACALREGDLVELKWPHEDRRQVLHELIFSCGYYYDNKYLWANWSELPIRFFDTENLPNYQVGSHAFEVVELKPGPYVGFQLTGDGRFLLGNGIVTHNTTCIREIVHNLQLRGVNYVVCSFTGKAVARIQEVLNKSRASNVATIHRLIMERMERPTYEHVIIDETSMVTEELFYRLTEAYPEVRQFTMLGDVNQLPPITWGNLFGQLLRSNCVPTYRLGTNYRVYNVQSQQYDGIILNANQLISNRHTHYQYTITDNFNIYEGHLGRVQDIVRACYAGGIQLAQLIILTPYNRYLSELNRIGQEIYNLGTPSVMDSKGNVWRVGDRVMLTKNNKEINVFNGEAGIITEVDDLAIEINFGPAGSHKFLLQIPNEQTDDNDAEHSDSRTVGILQQAYAITVDKSQGSEWDFVIFFIPEINTGNFLNKHRIYTAITRAKRACWCIVPDTILFSMASCRKLGYRCDNLASRLSEVLPPLPVWEDVQESITYPTLLMNNDDMSPEELAYFEDM